MARVTGFHDGLLLARPLSTEITAELIAPSACRLYDVQPRRRLGEPACQVPAQEVQEKQAGLRFCGTAGIYLQRLI